MTTLAAASAEPGVDCSELPVAGRASAEATRLRRLVEEHYDFVWRSLRRLGVPAIDAEDAAQEVFVSLSGRVLDVKPGCERGFLYRTAVNHAAHAHRSRLRRREVGDEALDQRPASTPSPEELLVGARARELFYLVLGELDLDLRAVFVLFELEQLTMAEIASFLEIPPGTVASRLRRARAAFLTHVTRVTGDTEPRGA